MASVKIIGKVAVKVMPDTSRFKDELRDDLNRIEKQIGDLKVSVIPVVDKTSEQKMKRELEALQNRLSGKDIDFDLALDKSDISYVEAALAAITRDRKTTIKVDIDQKSIQGVFDKLLMLGGARPQLDAVAKSLEQLGNFDYISISVAKMAVQFTTLAGAALAASGHMLSVGASIASIAKAGLVLPGMFGGIAIGLATSAAAFKDFGTYVPQAKQHMTDLQNTISGKFWAEASKEINAFVNGVFPILNKNLALTSTALGTFFGDFAAALGKTLNPALGGMFADLTKSIEIATGHVRSFATIIRVLGETGAGYLPRFATWFGQISDEFAGFLTKAQNDGTLTRWVEEGISALTALGSIVLSTGRIFNDLATAAKAAGGATLESLAADLKGIVDVVDSPAFKTGMTETFRAAFHMMNNITSGAGPGLKAMLLSLRDQFIIFGPAMGKALGGILGELGKALASPGTSAGMAAMFDGVITAMETLKGAVAPTVAIMASLGPVVGAMVTQISAIMTTGLDKLAPTIQGVAKAIVPVINTLGGLFKKIADDMTPVFVQLGENMIKLVGKFQPLIAAVQSFWNVLSPVLVPVLKIVVAILGDALMGVIAGVTMVFQGLAKIVGGTIKVWQGLWDVIAGIFTLDFSRIGDGFGKIFSGLWDVIVGTLQAVAGGVWAWINGSLFSIFRVGAVKLLAPFTKMFGKIKEFFAPLIGWFGAAFDLIVNGGKTGASKLDGIWGRIKDILIMPFEDAFAAIKGVWAGLTKVFGPIFEVIGTVVKAAVNVWVTIFKTAFDLIKTTVTVAWDVIRLIFTTVFTAIGTGLRATWTAITDFFRASMEGLYLTFTGPWNAIADFLVLLWNNIKVGAILIWDSIKMFLDDAMNTMRARIEVVWEAISGFFTKAWTGIKGIFTSALDAVKSVLTTQWNNMKTGAAMTWDAISSKISSVWNTIKSFVGNAVNNVKGLITSAWDAVKSKTDGIFDAVRSKISSAWESIKSSVSSASSNVKATMSNAWDSVKSTVNNAWESIKSAVGNKIGDVVDKIGTLPSKARSTLAGLGGVLINAGEDLIRGFMTGIGNMFGQVEAKLRALTNKLTSWKGPESLDKVLLTPAGEMVIEGFIKGLENRYASVRKSLTGFTNDIAKQFDTGANFKVGIEAQLTTSGKGLSAIDGLSHTVSSSTATPAADGGGSTIRIDNISIPLEDLRQLNTLEEFMDMLRVRTRQGSVTE